MPMDLYVYHIAKLKDNDVTLEPVDTNEDSVITTIGELVDLYKRVEHVPDLIVRAAGIPLLEANIAMFHEFLKSLVEWLSPVPYYLVSSLNRELPY